MNGVGTYSFSRLNADCLYCYYMDYIADKKEKLWKVSNGFADVGLVAHKVLEDFGNGKLLQFELKDRFLADSYSSQALVKSFNMVSEVDVSSKHAFVILCESTYSFLLAE